MKQFCKKINVMLIMCMFLFVACITGASISLASAAQLDDETNTKVEITSFTNIMSVDEEFEFAARVTYEDGTTSDVVTWSSSDNSVIDINDEGLAMALAEGNATITATADDGAYASVDVLVSDTEIRVTDVEIHPTTLDIGEGWTTRIGYTILPADAYEQRVTWASSDTSVITVDENGNVEALAAGTAEITATAYDGGLVATCAVVVYADFNEATLTPETITTSIGQVTDNDVEVVLPDDVDAVSYQWYSSVDSVASVDHNVDSKGSIFSWSYGTTTIYVVATTADGAKYAATGTVHVTADFFYITGLESDLDPNDPDDIDPWKTYDTEDEAAAARVLLTASAENPYVYSITRQFWAYDYFQIIHGDMDEYWTTKITSAWFNEDGSTMAYVANNADSFAVNALGTYNVTLDLSDGRAKVTIKMVDLTVTSVNLSVAEDSKPYLQGADNTMVLNVNAVPEAASYELSDVIVTVPADMSEDVTATPRQTDEGKLQIVLTLNKDYTTTTAFELGVQVENGTDDITVTILANGEEYVAVETIEFTSEYYVVNVNNGATEWISSSPLEALVNSKASVQGVIYSEDADEIYIEYIDGKPYVHAAALGTFTITATALGNSEVYAEVKVLVTSLTEDASGFYLIGTLNGGIVDNWTSIKPEETTFEGSDFGAWNLAVTERTGVYYDTFNLRQGDVFSIAFLGMDGNWNGVINNQYMNWTDSVGTYWNNGINIEITENGSYRVTLNLIDGTPSFKIEYVGTYDPEAEAYKLSLYIVRSGDAWDASISDADNAIAVVGYIMMKDGVAQGEFVYTLDAVDFYKFYTETGAWPTFQFVTATGIDGGYFQNATWYGSGYTGITFDGVAYDGNGASGHFTNWAGQSELYWSGDITEDMIVSFTFTFDENGALTKVGLNFATSSSEEAAE